jgi:glutaredoxin
MTTVTVFGREGCHLCDVATSVLEGMQAELSFEIEKIYIDGNMELEKLYGEQIPVIHIDGKHHDFFKVNPERFRLSLEKHRQHL